MLDRSPAQIYTVGGTVQAGGGVYLPRRADEELLALCEASAFAYVLTSRQMGKSSLIVHTTERLGERGVRSAVVDLQALGAGLSAEQWYLGLLTTIEDQLMLDTPALGWWREHADLGFPQRFAGYLRRVALPEVGAPLVIFFDEIDTTLSLDFTDDFFAGIRALYNARAEDPELRRLSFVLVGVATPGDLIRDPQRTPFNIGQRVDLGDFTPQEAAPLADGLGLPPGQAEATLRHVLSWTGGHPYLTQRLCLAIAERNAAAWRGEPGAGDPLLEALLGQPAWDRERVGELVAESFFGEQSERDHNLQFVRDMLTKRAPDPAAVLETYRDVRRGRRVPDEEQSIVKSHLKLSGVVRREGPALRVRNPIYATVFDEAWVRQHLPVNWPRALRRAALYLLVTLFALSLPLALYAWGQRSEALAARDEAVRARATAVAEGLIARTAEAESNSQRRIAEALSSVANLRRDNLSQPTGLRFATAAWRRADALPELEARAALEGLLREELYELDAPQEWLQLNPFRGPISGLIWGADGASVYAIDSEKLTALDSSNGVERAMVPLAVPGYFIDSRVSPDGQRVIVLDYQIGRLITVGLDRPGVELIGLGDKQAPEAFWSADSRRFFGWVGQEVRVWDASTSDGQPRCVLRHAGGVVSAAISPDGSLLATVTADDDRALWLWRLPPAAGEGCPDLAVPARIAPHGGGVRSVAFSPDGARILTASWDTTARTWDTSGAELLALRGHSGAVFSAEWSPDGARVLTASDDGTVRAWDASTGAELGENQLFAPADDRPDRAILARWSPDSRRVLIATNLGDPPQVWEPESGASTFLVDTNRNGAYNWCPDGGCVVYIKSLGFGWCPDSCSLSSNSPPQRYDLPAPGAALSPGARLSPEPIGLQGSTRFLAWSPDGSRLLIANDTPEIAIWERESDVTQQLLASTPQGEVLGISADGERIALLSWAGGLSLRLMERAGGRVIGTQTTDAIEPDTFLATWPAEDYDGVVEPGGRLAFATKSGAVWVWDMDAPHQFSEIAIADTRLSPDRFSPDGRRLLLTDQEGYLIWDLERGRAALRLPYYIDPAGAIQADGKRAAGLAADGSLAIWDFAEDRAVLRVGGQISDTLDFFSLSPDGTRMLLSTIDESGRTLALWEEGQTAPVVSFGPEATPFSVVSPAGWLRDDRFAIERASQADSKIEIWDASQARLVAEIEGSFAQNLLHVGKRTLVSFADGTLTSISLDDGRQQQIDWQVEASCCAHPNPDETRLLLSATNRPELYLLDLANGQLTTVSTTPLYGQVYWSPDGALFAVSGDTVRLYDGLSGEYLRSLPGVAGEVIWQPGGRLLLGQSGFTYELQVLDSADGALLLNLGRTPNYERARWSADGSLVLRSNSEDGRLEIWDVGTRRLSGVISDPEGLLRRTAVSPDGREAIVNGPNSYARVWDLAGERVRLALPHAAPVRAVAWSADGARLASADDAGTVRLWSATDGAPLGALEGLPGGARALALSADGRQALVAPADRPPRLWDSASGAERELGNQPATAVALSPDGALGLTGDGAGRVRLWSAADGALLAELSARSSGVAAVALSPDGSQAASGGLDGLVLLSPAGAGAEARELRGHSGPVSSLAFSPDGKRLISASLDGSALVWDVASGTQLFALPRASEEGLTAAGWSADGRHLFAAGFEGLSVLYHVGRAEDLLSVAACLLPEALEDMSEPERSRYLVGALREIEPAPFPPPDATRCAALTTPPADEDQASSRRS